MPRATHRVSIKGIIANRANAKRSTGPRTPEGKSRSSQNARKHTFDPSAFPVVRFEEVGQIDRLRQDALAIFKPVNSQETFAIEQIVLAQNALLRAERIISGLLTDSLNRTMTSDGRPVFGLSPHLVDENHTIVQSQNRNFLLAHGFHALYVEAPSFLVALRYQSQAERLYRRAVADFDRLRTLRQELAIEPDFCAQSQEKTQLTPTENEPVNLPYSDPRRTAAELLPSHPRLAPEVPATSLYPRVHLVPRVRIRSKSTRARRNFEARHRGVSLPFAHSKTTALLPNGQPPRARARQPAGQRLPTRIRGSPYWASAKAR